LKAKNPVKKKANVKLPRRTGITESKPTSPSKIPPMITKENNKITQKRKNRTIFLSVFSRPSKTGLSFDFLIIIPYSWVMRFLLLTLTITKRQVHCSSETDILPYLSFHPRLTESGS
jgi:hypothetical protein